jgi:hypothetical protein
MVVEEETVQNVNEIAPRWLQLKPRPADTEAQGADDASPISLFAGALVRAVEMGPPAPPPSPPFSALVPCTHTVLPSTLALGHSVPVAPLGPPGQDRK